jgi:hypothetical protein
VINLAAGGYTTYHVLPTGQAPPPGRPAPDPARNITAAIALRPDAIVVNLPSNDVALGYTVEEQLRNYDTLRAVADTIPLWIATPQPRNLGAAGRGLLMVMRDSTLARYAPRTIDFWTVLASPDGTIEPAFDSGDGIHLNSAGHRILFERAVAARILGETPTAGGHGRPAARPLALAVRPNPFRGRGTVSIATREPGRIHITLRDAAGRHVATLFDGSLPAGTHQLPFYVPAASGTYVVHARAGSSTAGLVVTSR